MRRTLKRLRLLYIPEDGLKLQGAHRNRNAIGAKIRWPAGGVVRSRLKNNGVSYL
jgi:hypothetical protein